jgi:hypothetical protein
MAKKKPPKTWMLPTPKKAKAPLPESIKADLDAKATKLVKDVLKPRYVQPPPKNARSITSPTCGSSGLAARCTSERHSPALVPRQCFRRSRHGSPAWNMSGGGRFTLSYMRHTDKWFRLFPNLTADECLDAVENDCHFQLI